MEKTERNKSIFVELMNGASLSDLACEHNLNKARVRELAGNYARKYHRPIFDEALKETRIRTGTFRQLQPAIDVLREYRFEVE